jgi:hypothetical protein
VDKDKNKITIGEAFDALDKAITEWVSSDVADTNDIEVINEAVKADLNFRDLLTGLPKHYDLEKCVGFISYFASLVDGTDKVPYISVLSACEFEKGNNEGAINLIDKALEINSEYALAKLLKRVYFAGWEPSVFVQMRNQLDPKVRTSALEMKDITIGELLNA